MTNPVFPKFARTAHPDVLAAVQANIDRRDAFMAKARAVSEKYTGDPNAGYINGSTFAGMNFSGLSASAVRDHSTLPGQWKRPTRGKLAPFKNNREVQEDFNIGYQPVRIPGRGNLIWGVGFMGTGTLFEWEGEVYSHIRFDMFGMDDKTYLEFQVYGWVEILGSVYYAAEEARNADLS